MTRKQHQPLEGQPGIPPGPGATEPKPPTPLEVEPLSGPTEASADASPPVEPDSQALVDLPFRTPAPDWPPAEPEPTRE